MEKSGVGRLKSRLSVNRVTTGSTAVLLQNRYSNVASSLQLRRIKVMFNHSGELFEWRALCCEHGHCVAPK
jgi:hypothetical protein